MLLFFSFYEWMYKKKKNPVGNKLNVGAPSQEFEPQISKWHTTAPDI